MYKYLLILCCFVSCQIKKETTPNDLLEIVLDNYYEHKENENQNCTYVQMLHNFEKNIYHFVLSKQICGEGFADLYKTAGYKNRNLYFVENLPFNTIEDFTNIEFIQRTPVLLNNKEAKDKEFFDDKKVRYYYSVQIKPYKILKIVRLTSNKELDVLFVDDNYKEPKTKEFSNVIFNLINDFDTLKVELRNEKIHKNDRIVDSINIYKNGIFIADELNLRTNYFFNYIKTAENFNLRPYSEIKNEVKHDYIPYDFLEISILYDDEKSRLFEIPLNKVRLNQEFETLIKKINNIENADLFPSEKKEDKVYRLVETKAYPDYSFSLLSQKMLKKYPKLDTTIKLQFIVEKDGNLTDIILLNKGDLDIKQEEFLIKTLKISGQWNPAKLKDSIVRMQFVLPLKITP